MKVEQLYTECLAQGSYYIESNGEAVVIDPLREVGTYMSMAAERRESRQLNMFLKLTFMLIL